MSRNFNYDGTGRRVNCGAFNVPASSYITGACWWNPNNSGQGASDFRYFSKAKNTAQSGHIFMLGNYSATAIRLRVRLGVDGSYAGQTDLGDTHSTYTVGQWYHVGFTWDGSTIYFYVDGVQDTATGSLSGSYVTTSSDELFIGSNPTTGASETRGRICEVAIWSVPLTEDEFAQLYAGVPTWKIRQTDLCGYWPLWGRTDPEPELTGSGFTGALYGSPAYYRQAPIAFRPRFYIISPYLEEEGGAGAQSATLQMASATAAGYPVSVTLGQLDATLEMANAVAAGYPVTITQAGPAQSVTLQMASATASGLPVTIDTSTSITLGMANATATANPATVTLGTLSSILEVANADAAGYAVTVDQGGAAQSITLEMANAVAANYPVEITLGQLDSVLGMADATAEGLAVTVDQAGGLQSATLGMADATADGYQLSVVLGQVAAVLEMAAATAENYPATVTLGQVSATLEMAEALASGYPVTVALGQVSATLQMAEATAEGIRVYVTVSGSQEATLQMANAIAEGIPLKIGSKVDPIFLTAL